ncbi:hypothetical protein OG921_03025 [Aldersonia sp. NBC_00410]|uniref:hypothetical protein n=1 Tax=Aldersonia sp. NBC_00410 TaxID=2975954 RepID=UPI002257FF2C|nr:hypothetical protein [Aldersonia sp. NBC_00410]MCX5042164.1 hypothetical protein [Aldersonia sp. NBC_00410]
MKTVLPIPEQSGFVLLLPESVRLAPETVITNTPVGIKLFRNGCALEISLPVDACAPFQRALGGQGAGMSTAGLALCWRQLMEKLAACGFLSDAVPSDTAEFVSALNTLTTVIDTIHQHEVKAFPSSHALNRLIAGEYAQSAVVEWLVENYHYTKSAPTHIAPVFGHAMSAAERLLWQRFYEDESWHWRIYRPALHQFGLDFKTVDLRPPAKATARFISALRSAAEASAIAYAAVMLFIERPPLCTDMNDDPLFGSLLRSHGFSRRSIQPLWWHAVENLSAGHSGLGAAVILNRGQIPRTELDTAISAVRDVVEATSAWHQDILEPR